MMRPWRSAAPGRCQCGAPIQTWLGIGALDQAAIDEVCAQAWPDVRDVEEFHDVLLSFGVLPLDGATPGKSYAQELVQDGRATLLVGISADRCRPMAPMSPLNAAARTSRHPDVVCQPAIEPPILRRRTMRNSARKTLCG